MRMVADLHPLRVKHVLQELLIEDIVPIRLQIDAAALRPFPHLQRPFRPRLHPVQLLERDEYRIILQPLTFPAEAVILLLE